MANGSVRTNDGGKVALNRTYKSSPDYTPTTQFSVGEGQTTPSIADTAMEIPVPIEDGTVNDDGSNTMTGSSGADNSTDNTTTYKPGAGVSDATAQNLIANDTNTNKRWSISDLSSAGTNITITEYAGLWLYIKDSTAYAKFKSSGTALQIKMGSDSSNYYSDAITRASLSIGWNWISMGIVSDLTETGTVGSPVNYFEIQIVTNNATDTFIAGDVVYDLLRTWTDANTKKDWKTGYPSLDETTLTATFRGEVLTTEGVGFNLGEFGGFNEDGTPKLTSHSVFDPDGKSDTDEFIFVLKEGFTQ